MLYKVYSTDVPMPACKDSHPQCFEHAAISVFSMLCLGENTAMAATAAVAAASISAGFRHHISFKTGDMCEERLSGEAQKCSAWFEPKLQHTTSIKISVNAVVYSCHLTLHCKCWPSTMQAATTSLDCSQKMVITLAVDNGDTVASQQLQFNVQCIGR